MEVRKGPAEDEEPGYDADDEEEDDRSVVAEAGDVGDVTDVPLVVDVSQLVDFLRAAPAPAEWRYQGWGKGGYVLAWTGTSELLDPTGQACTVRIHVHTSIRPSGGLSWNFGGAWVAGTSASLTINDKLGSSGDAKRLEAVVERFLPRIKKEIEARSKG